MTKTLTPDHLRCGSGLCNSVTQLDDGRLEITGDMVDCKQAVPATDYMEATIVISPDYFSNLPEMVRLRERVAELENLCQANASITGEGSSPIGSSIERGAEAIKLAEEVRQNLIDHANAIISDGRFKDDLAAEFDYMARGVGVFLQQFRRQIEEDERTAEG